MSGKTLVVFGATGKQGRAVLEYFLGAGRDAFTTLRGVTRNPESEAAKALQARGVQMVQGDFASCESLQQALAGATHVFANTDSAQPIFHAMQHPDVLRAGQDPFTYAKEVELGYGANLRRAFAATASIARIVYSALPSPKKWTGGKLSHATMFDVQEEVADSLLADPALASKVSVIYLGFYGDNALLLPPVYAPKKQADGSYELALPVSGDAKFAYADVEKDVGKWLVALFQSPPGCTLIGASDYYTFKEWVRAWAAANNVQARFKEVSLQAFAAAVSGLGLPLGEMMQFAAEHGFAASNEKVIEFDQIAPKGVDPHGTSYEDYIRAQDWSAIL